MNKKDVKFTHRWPVVWNWILFCIWYRYTNFRKCHRVILFQRIY